MSEPLELGERITSSRRSSNDVETLRSEEHIQVYIDNPLDNLTLEELEEAVTNFRQQYGLTNYVDEKLLQRGALIGAAFTKNWIQLFFCRCLLGIGMGSKAATVPVYAAENSPAFFRGSFVMSWQLWVAFGIFLGFSANLAVYQVPDIGWRLQLGSAFIPAVPLLILIWWAPESPRWYIKQNCYPQAYHSLLRLRNVPLQAARDLYYMHVQIEIENRMLAAEQQARNGGRQEEARNRTPVARDLHKAALYVRRFVQLFTIGRIVIFYSATLFVEAKADTQTALLVSWGFGLANFV
ncbi:putative sugar inositol transporter protein [Neofusicoccum parvum UCRNP2]|uniref:Putative sugar inositol transporter protein n=1 Tax=Botryosphaeria parva (strain UCR-NP2) TaxID=1287680 RepID=R1GZ55_BOTPV|nr:putative sugar inositol transporter protein [Neofusicoccum parvum UCRNP2]